MRTTFKCYWQHDIGCRQITDLYCSLEIGTLRQRNEPANRTSLKRMMNDDDNITD